MRTATIVRASLIGLGLLILNGQANAADPPSAKLALSFKPVQKDVEIETPKPSEYDKCRVKVERGGKESGWVVYGPAGQIVRRFIDTNGDNVVDQWRYYNQGLEVYRDIDSNFNNKVDQSRWLNMGGSRWGLDADEDGKIESWKVISAEEVSREVVRAMVARNETALKALLVSSDDLKAVGLNSTLAKKILEAVEKPGKKMRTAVSSSKLLTKKTRWMRFDSLMPSTIPASKDHSSTDLTVYENAMAIVEVDGTTGLLQIGEMILVGKTWKLTQIPRPLEGNSIQVTIGGLLMRPEIAGLATGTSVGDISPAMRKLLEKLQKLDGDSPSPTASTPVLTSYNKKRAEILSQLADASKTDKERQQWTRQLVDGITAAIQTGTFPKGIQRLDSVLADVRKKSSKTPLLAYVSYRHLLAGYSVEMQQAKNSERADVQKRWLNALEKFTGDYPTAEDAPDAMLQLAISKEFGGEQKVARKWYAQLATDYAKTAAGVRAVGAIRRLDLVGKSFSFTATGLKGGKINASSYRGKVLLVLFWSTWCKPCTEDLPQMRELYRLYHAAGFEILGVNLDTTIDPVGSYLKQHKVAWPQVYEPGGLDSSPAREFGIISLPTLFLVDKSGKVVGRNVSIDDLKKQIPDLLKKKK